MERKSPKLPKVDERKFVTELFYYKLVVAHYEASQLQHLRTIIKAIFPTGLTIKLVEVHHKDGKETEKELSI